MLRTSGELPFFMCLVAWCEDGSRRHASALQETRSMPGVNGTVKQILPSTYEGVGSKRDGVLFNGIIMELIYGAYYL